MYNADIPSTNELPSTRQLIISTFGALCVAIVLLVSAVLPAEYGIDPTGIGRVLGLTQMGEIKTQLADEAAADTAPVIVVTQNQTEDTELVPVVDQPTVDQPAVDQSVMNQVVNTYVLQPGDAVEVKLAMQEDQRVMYDWSVDQGHVNFDTHGDKPGIKYHNYNKGKAVTGDKGELVADFTGKHGWFWRNRSSQTVTVTLTVSGEYSDIQRVL